MLFIFHKLGVSISYILSFPNKYLHNIIIVTTVESEKRRLVYYNFDLLQQTECRLQGEWEMDGQGKVVCVTGASGYIASWLVKLLLQRGYTVKATVRDPSQISTQLQNFSFLNPTCYYPQFSSFFIVSVLFKHNVSFMHVGGPLFSSVKLRLSGILMGLYPFSFSRSLIYDWKSIFSTRVFVLS